MSSATEEQVISPAVLKKVEPAEWSEPELVLNKRSYSWLTDKICGIVEAKTPTWWWWCFMVLKVPHARAPPS